MRFAYNKFSGGTWTLHNGEGSIAIVNGPAKPSAYGVEVGAGTYIATIEPATAQNRNGFFAPREEAAGNAALIVAAPLMLNALKLAENELSRLREQIEATKAQIGLGNTEVVQANVSAAIAIAMGLV